VEIGKTRNCVETRRPKFSDVSVLTLSYINTALSQSAFRIYKCYIIKVYEFIRRHPSSSLILTHLFVHIRQEKKITSEIRSKNRKCKRALTLICSMLSQPTYTYDLDAQYPKILTFLAGSHYAMQRTSYSKDNLHIKKLLNISSTKQVWQRIFFGNFVFSSRCNHHKRMVWNFGIGIMTKLHRLFAI
jgi:hypothetical protein